MKKTGSYFDLLKPRILHGLLSLGIKGYFVERGWLTSYLKRQAVDKEGNPIPWLTYSFLDFLDGRLNKSISLFEYGAGNSTYFFAKQVKSVKSVESDKEWYNKMKNDLPDNADISFVPLGNNGTYPGAILLEPIRFDMVLIDGRERVASLRNAVEKLSEQGVIVLDDSERQKYQEAFHIMANAGFRYIKFSGIAIGGIHDKCTTVFYRSSNCLGI